MLRQMIFGCGLAAVFAATSSAFPPAPPCKAVAPIDLEARLEGDPDTSCCITASASARGRDVELEIVLPAGLAALAGDRKGAGRRVELRLDARALDRTRREVFVRASIREGDAVLTRVEPLVIHDVPSPPKGVLRKGSRGEPTLEFGP